MPCDIVGMTYNINLFSDEAEFSDGSQLGPSTSVIGQGLPTIVVLHNPGNALVGMQTRPVVSAANPDPKWSAIGGTVTADKQRYNLLLAGFEYRAYIFDAPTSGLKCKFQALTLSRVSGQTEHHNDLLRSFGSNNTAGFALRDDNDLVAVGDVDALKETNAPLFVCYSADAAEMAFYGGLWVRTAGDYVKQQINTSQLLLTTAIANYPLTTTPVTTPGTTTGTIGQPPIDRSTPGTVSYIDATDTNFIFNIFSSSVGEVLWPKHPTEATGDYYELTLNGIIVAQEAKYAHSFNNLSPSTTYEVTLRFIRANGDYSDAVVITKTTPATGTTTTTGTTPTSDGALTTDPFWVIDAASSLYENAGLNGQVWTKTVGDDDSTGVGTIVSQGATETEGNGAAAFYQNVPQYSTDPNAERFIWARMRSATTGSLVNARSAGNGTPGQAVVNDTDYEWVKFGANYQPYDSELQLQGITTGIEVDRFILMLATDSTVPTGKDGLRSS